MSLARATRLDREATRTAAVRKAILALPKDDPRRIEFLAKAAANLAKWKKKNALKVKEVKREGMRRLSMRKKVAAALQLLGDATTLTGVKTWLPRRSRKLKAPVIDGLLSSLTRTHSYSAVTTSPTSLLTDEGAQRGAKRSRMKRVIKGTDTTPSPTSLLADVGGQWGVTRPRTKLVGKSNEGNQQTEPRLETAPSETSPHAPVVTEEFKQRRKAKFLELFDSASPPTLSPPASPTNQVQPFKHDLDLNHTPPSSTSP